MAVGLGGGVVGPLEKFIWARSRVVVISWRLNATAFGEEEKYAWRTAATTFIIQFRLREWQTTTTYLLCA